MIRKPKRPAGEKAKIKHMNSSEVDSKKYDTFDLDKNNNLIKIAKKRPEINRSISLTNSYEKRNIMTNSLPPSKSLDNSLTPTYKKPIALHLKNLKKSKSKLPIQATSATSLSSANQSTKKLSSIKAASFDTTLLTAPLSKVTLTNIRHTVSTLSLRPRSVSDCSNCILKSNLHLAHRAQIEFIKVIKRDRDFINSFKKFNRNDLYKSKDKSKELTTADSRTETDRPAKTKNDFQLTDLNEKLNQNESIPHRSTAKNAGKLNVDDVVRKFREKYREHFLEQTKLHKIKAPAICIDDYLFSWVPPGLTTEQVSGFFKIKYYIY